MMVVSIICPKCRRAEKIPIVANNMIEYHLLGSTSIAVYHVDHVLIVSVDKYGVKATSVCDPPSILVHSLNTIVGEYLLIRNPILTSKYEVMFIDLDRKIADARTIQNHMYAISFVRYLSKSGNKIPENGILNAYGMNFLVERNGNLLVAVLMKESENIEAIKSQVESLAETIDKIPLSLEKMVTVLSS